MFKHLDFLAGYFLSSFFSLIGFRDPAVEDDSAVLPYVKRVLENTPYSGLEVGRRLGARSWEHAVRYLGDSHVIKYVSPEPIGLMRVWLSELERQKKLLQRYFPSNLVLFEYFLIPSEKSDSVRNSLFGNSNCRSERIEEAAEERGWASSSGGKELSFGDSLKPSSEEFDADKGSGFGELAGRVEEYATYVAVMEKVCGRSLYELSDEDIFSNETLVQSLLEFFEANQRLRRDHGLFVDVVGGSAAKILNPRYTGNLFITEDSQVIIVDTVLIPARYKKDETPAKYRLGWLYHFCYNLLVRPFEKRFISSLKQALLV